jgi:formylglycine-generating enzyme required for sulfatase activity/photosystem II stability/assembly factor-like uncharacterized protein
MRISRISLVLILALYCSVASAQWVQTNGPGGGYIWALAVCDGNVFAAAGGVYRSTDNGITWTEMNSDLGVYCLAAVGSNLFAGTDGGVYLSTDDGVSWTVKGLTSSSHIYSLAVIGTTLFAGSFGHVYRSTDNGATWTGGQNGLPYNDILELAANESSLFAGLSGHGIFRSTDQGESWAQLSNGIPTDQSVFSLAFNGGYIFAGVAGHGVYRSIDNGISWASANVGMSDYVEVDALAANGPSLFAGTWGGVFVSTNCGTSWTAANGGLPPGNTWPLVFQCFAFNGPILYTGTNGAGIFLSSDNGTSWKAANDGITRSTVRTLASGGANVYAGGDYVGIVVTTDAGASWKDLTKETPLNGNAISFGIHNTAIVAGTDRGHVYFSSNDGRDWKDVTDGLPFWTGDYVNSAVFSDTTLFIASSSGVFRSTNGGTSWSDARYGLPKISNVTALVVVDGNLFAGTLFGVYLSTNGGTKWMPTNIEADVRALAFSGGNLFAGTYNGIYRSTNRGGNWSPANNGLQARSTVSILVSGPDGTSESNLFAVINDTSIFVSTNAGDSWTSVHAGLPSRYGIRSLGVCGDYLFAGVNSRAVWKRPIAEIIADFTTGMLLVEGGEFSMGSLSGDPDEQPVHLVNVGNFYLDSKEVAVRDYRAFCAVTGRTMPTSPGWGWIDDYPVVNVSWDDATAYAQWKGKRLPTEAEWEYAARGGKFSHGYLYSGSNLSDSVAWDSLSSAGLPHATGGKTPNELGLYDLSGNVWEWCSDWYDAAYYNVSPATEPKGPATGVGLRVTRGGSFRNGPYACRVSDRSGYWHDSYAEDTGFRLAMDAPVTSTEGQVHPRVPPIFALEQNYPNPFNPLTIIHYAIGGCRGQESGINVKLKVYDLLGRHVKTLVDERKLPGQYQARFDALALPSGVYFYRMEAGTFVQTRKMLLIK